MALNRLVVRVLIIALVDAVAIEHDNIGSGKVGEDIKSDLLPEANAGESDSPNNAFIGVYSECFLHLSYTCLQKKTLQYLKELDKLSEISVIGDYVKFVKLNATEVRKRNDIEDSKVKSSEELSHMIDKAVDHFFSNHFIRLSALGKDILVPHSVEEFVGRKRRKGGGGGGHGGGDGDGGKKKMMMMAMMCMKMKLMMMVPAMMGMMGMMSFKGMMFSMMSFMISKMMLLMKILEKKGGGGGGGGGGGDGGWAAGGGGGGAWMPAGGADYGGGGGYDANAQWSSRSILEKVVEDKFKTNEKPIITYVKPIIRYNNNINDKKPLTITKNLNDEIIKANNLFEGEAKSRRKRGIMDVLQNAYMYWANKVLGFNNYKFKHPNFPKYKIINGVKYVYYPIRQIQKAKAPKEYPIHNIKISDDDKPVVIAEDFNKGEIVEGAAESRMSRKKLHKMTDNMNETMDENPWQ